MKTRRPFSQHDYAYAFFLAPVVACLAEPLGSIVPMSTGTAGAIGFFILMPAALLSVVAVFRGFYGAFAWKDPILALLSLVTIAVVVVLSTEPVSSTLFLASSVIYAGLVVACEAWWFLVQRFEGHADEPDQAAGA